MKNKDKESIAFQLFPIGKIEIQEHVSFIHMLPPYKKALKQLNLFSHALLFFKDDKKGDCMIELRVVKMLKVEANQGVIAIDDATFDEGSLVFDIKPYFPCEDRVKEVRLPDSLEKDPLWRQERIMSQSKGNTNSLSSSDLDYRFSTGQHKSTLFKHSLGTSHYIQQVGTIRLIDGTYFLKLPHLDKEKMTYLKDFSHLKIMWWFNRFDKENYRKITESKPPYEKAPKTGIFATRSPVRPNPIALTTVKILGVDQEEGGIKVSQMDAFDNTPVIGLFPYMPVYDRVKEFSVPPWLDHWPQWVEDGEYHSIVKDTAIKQSDLKKIKRFIIEENAQGNKLFLKEPTQRSNSSLDYILVKGARENNLKNIHCQIPKNKMTVLTGVSGSGKSSLAFDTIYAESQRRFMDSLSISSRSIVDQIGKPDFDQIIGLPPAIAIEQKILGRNPRSTVGTITDIYDYLKLLFARIGIRHCPDCGRAIVLLKEDEIFNMLSKLKPYICFSIRAFDQKKVENFVVADCEDTLYRERLRKEMREALEIGRGCIVVTIGEEEFLFQTRQMCYHCNKIFFELTPSTFSFNNPESMCPVCKGLGVKLQVDVDKIISNPEVSILDGASPWWGNLRKHREKPNANWMKGEILALAQEMKVDLELPWKALPEDFKRQTLYGSGERKVRFVYENTNGRKGEIIRPVEGAYNVIVRLFKENKAVNNLIASFMSESVCESCQGERLKDEGRFVTVAGTRLPETLVMTIDQLKQWVCHLSLSEEEMQIGHLILKDIGKRLDHLIDIGVSYLTLDRSVPTLSGGEAQRIRLATQLNSGITNILYVLDEPSIGLHPKDCKGLIDTMYKIRDEGNTLIVVEHDSDIMMAADKIMDIGPGAGTHGGQILAEGSVDDIMVDKNSKTGQYLNAIKKGTWIEGKEKMKPRGWLKIRNAKHHNLKNIDVSIPLGVLTCITGVSGSGKSSLVFDTLYPLVDGYFNASDSTIMPEGMEGIDELDSIISISQQPIGKTSRSNPATYTGVWDDIRRLYASLNESKKKGYKQNKFSFNSKEGECPACCGKGGDYIPMHFMADVWVECSICHGQRLNNEALEIHYKGKSIGDVLCMNVEEALEFFQDQPKIKKVLKTLNDVGLGYIQLGQNAKTLSGGEAQRIKLAKELSKQNTGKTLYLLDEPTTGLHFEDVENLLGILKRIVEAGNTVLVIEHNLDIIRNGDWVIDLGPEGGDEGGNIVAEGTPEEIMDVAGSYTGQCLKKLYNKL